MLKNLKKGKKVLTSANNKWYYIVVVSKETRESYKKLSKKLLTRVVNLDIITNVVSGNGGIGRRAGLRIL